MTLDVRLFLTIAGLAGAAGLVSALLFSGLVPERSGLAAAALLAMPGLGACWMAARRASAPLRTLAAAARAAAEPAQPADAALQAAAHELASSPCEVGRLAKAMCRLSAGLREAREARERLSHIVDGIADILLVTDAEGRITAANRSLASLAMHGGPSDGRYFWDILRCEDHDLRMVHARLQAGETIDSLEIHLQAGPGRAGLPALLSGAAMAHGGDGFVYVLRDISERKRLEEEVLRIALYDELTSLPNRAHLLKRLRELSARCAAGEAAVGAGEAPRPCVLFVDLDRFKKVNDSFGHAVGDELLQHIARRLDGQVRGSDMVARLGGDEFVVLLCDMESAGRAEQVAMRILDCLAQPFSVGSRSLTVGGSAGMAWLEPGADPLEALTNADIAMYRSKARGGQVCTPYNQSMRQDVERLVDLESGLRNALGDKAFEVIYQPIVSARSGQASGLEALVRWRHPQHGLIPPQEFLPLAVETGLMAPIGRVVWERALEDMRGLLARLPGKDPLFVSLNISAAELFSTNFAADFLRILKRSGMPAQQVVLEITEAALLEQPDRARRILEEIKAGGVRLALDDFGTGFSSLSHLATFPLDMLKIDKSFIGSRSRTAQGDEIARGAASLARNMRLWLVAEGVEDLKDFDFAMSLPCDYYQGFFFSAPQHLAEAEAFLQANRLMHEGDAAEPDAPMLAPRDDGQRWKM